jgi:type IV pilus assembly protein PilA
MSQSSIEPMFAPRPQRQRSSSAGFTMVELLAVVAMIGILSAIAMVGYRRYLNAAKTSDAKAVISAIRVAQESFRAETMTYANCSADSLQAYYPTDNNNGGKMLWRNPGHQHWACWSQLNVQVDSPTTFRFATTAGAPGDAATPTNTTTPISWPSPTTEPWFVIQAVGNADADAIPSILVSSSFNGEIYVENESE